MDDGSNVSKNLCKSQTSPDVIIMAILDSMDEWYIGIKSQSQDQPRISLPGKDWVASASGVEYILQEDDPANAG